jgi:DNA-binding XRE family transcriptional regulator
MKDLATDMFNYRVEHDMSQTDLAKLCRISIQTVNSVENRKQNPSKMTRAKLERVIYANEGENNGNVTDEKAE